MPMRFAIDATCGHARAATLATDRGRVETPVFMPVGTQATVKATPPPWLRDPIGAQIVLGNTYHLLLRPGVERIERAGGLHRFMGWDGPILTDSGGYQVLSLAELRRVSDRGVTFRSHVDGAPLELTPESAVEAQIRIGADIAMALDECVRIPCTREAAEAAVARTTAWARRGRGVAGARWTIDGVERVLFGIVQGASWADLRRRSARQLVDLDLAGYAIGGLSVGETPDVTWAMTEATVEELPADRPRYLMGVGTPVDLVEAVARGVDMADCVMPTRNARNGTVFTRDGRVVLRNAAHADAFEPIEPGCRCLACRTLSRAYLRHLFIAGEILGPVLATQHNLVFYCDLMREMRREIVAGTFDAWRRAFVERYTAGERARRARGATSREAT